MYVGLDIGGTKILGGLFDKQTLAPRGMGDHHIRMKTLLLELHGPMQHGFAANDFGLHINDPGVYALGAAAAWEVGVNLHPLPQHAGFVGQEQGMHLMPERSQCRGQVFELTGKILVKK